MGINDWTGNSVFSTLGSSSHSEYERSCGDFYSTDPVAVEKLLKVEDFSNDIWECACGDGSMSRVLESAGYRVRSSDLFDRGYGETGYDFLSLLNQDWHGDIITNPPYIYAQEFVEKALNVIHKGNKVAMFLRLLFLEGKRRRELFRVSPPVRVWVMSERVNCYRNGVISNFSSAVCYAWFVWVKGYRGDSILGWL